MAFGVRNRVRMVRVRKMQCSVYCGCLRCAAALLLSSVIAEALLTLFTFILCRRGPSRVRGVQADGTVPCIRDAGSIQQNLLVFDRLLERFNTGGRLNA